MRKYWCSQSIKKIIPISHMINCNLQMQNFPFVMFYTAICRPSLNILFKRNAA